jgi:hypothetical protein
MSNRHRGYLLQRNTTDDMLLKSKFFWEQSLLVSVSTNTNRNFCLILFDRSVKYVKPSEDPVIVN